MTATLDPSTEAGAHALERLATERMGWLTSVTPSGQPQTLPIWFLWADGEVFLYSRKTAKRNENIRAEPRVSFNLDTEDDGDDVVAMEGTARFDPDGPLCSQYPEYIAKYAGKLEEYGWGPDHMDREYPIIIRVTPTRWRGVG
jgi:PPOX class probable F420-dependent enzyme